MDNEKFLAACKAAGVPGEVVAQIKLHLPAIAAEYNRSAQAEPTTEVK